MAIGDRIAKPLKASVAEQAGERLQRVMSGPASRGSAAAESKSEALEGPGNLAARGVIPERERLEEGGFAQTRMARSR